MSTRMIRARAKAYELADPLKRRWRGGGSDPIAGARREQAAEPWPPFAIDAVITWVDGTDPAWQERRNWFASEGGFENSARPQSRAAHDFARYQHLDELRYCLRAIEAYAPWIRRVHVVTDRQHPAWLRPGSVRVIDHRSILPPYALPTFNSHAIEACLYRIPDLAENFLYFNDDFLLMSPALPQMFFSPEGQIRTAWSALPVPAGFPTLEDSAAVAGAKNVRELLGAHFEQPVDRLLTHAPLAQLKSVHEELRWKYADVLAATECSRYRSLADVSPIFLHQWFATMTGRGTSTTFNWRYLELARQADVRRVEVEVARRDTDTLCLNLASDPQTPWPELQRLVSRSLAARFPKRSRFELEA